ncbi:MAG: PD-(D/E)XK nuclease [Caudoviricetes sp.]|nr:MAG: PD-(D/E)XK nuclease [Caudoviricetes sp.]
MFWMTQSLLNSWTYYLNADDEHCDEAWASFLSTLRRERRDPTKAMQDGILFEDMVNRLVSGEPLEGEFVAKWDAAARRFAAKCMGGQSQVPVTGELSVCGMDFVLYGICDYVKAGIIYDIKKVTRYEYGKYFHSPQHPMYLHLVPEAKRFEYLIFDGSNCHVEPYCRGDYQPIKQTITDFIRFLKDTDELEVYKAFWGMNRKREEKRSVIA